MKGRADEFDWSMARNQSMRRTRHTLLTLNESTFDKYIKEEEEERTRD
jgi:hypothetical protein